MFIPNKYCPMGIQQGLVCKGELCMWFDGERCNPLGLPRVKPEAAEVEAPAEATVEEKPKPTRRKKDAALTQ